MHLHCAFITEENFKYAIVLVHKHLIIDQQQAEQTVLYFEKQYFGMPTVLIAQSHNGTPQGFYGRRDIGLRLLNQPLAELHWRQVALN